MIRQRKYVIMEVGYFTKWLEAEAIKNVTARQMIDFVWGNIICRFRVPRVLISDNATQFDCKDFREFIKNLGIHHKFALVAHPHTCETKPVSGWQCINNEPLITITIRSKKGCLEWNI